MLHLNKKSIIISSWAPPAIGGPQNLYNIFSYVDSLDYVILTSKINFVSSNRVGSKLPCEYFFYNSIKLKASVKTSIFLKLLNLIKLVFDLILLLPKGSFIIFRNKINLLIGISDTGPALIYTYLLSLITKRSYVIYLFDLYLGNNLPRFLNFIAKYFEPLLFSRAKAIIVTNEVTKEYYHKKYPKKNIHIIYNSVIAESYTANRKSYIFLEPYKIIFTGNVYWAQLQSILNLIEAIPRLKTKNTELHLYIPSVPQILREKIANKKNIFLKSANQSEMPVIQSQASLLYLPLSWNTNNSDIIATASPGKFTDYLASGRVMLIHAPEYAYVSKYAKKHGLGIVVDQNDVEKLKSAIDDFFEKKDISIANNMIQNSLNDFFEKRTAGNNAKTLTKILNSL